MSGASFDKVGACEVRDEEPVSRTSSSLVRDEETVSGISSSSNIHTGNFTTSQVIYIKDNTKVQNTRRTPVCTITTFTCPGNNGWDEPAMVLMILLVSC